MLITTARHGQYLHRLVPWLPMLFPRIISTLSTLFGLPPAGTVRTMGTARVLPMSKLLKIVFMAVCPITLLRNASGGSLSSGKGPVNFRWAIGNASKRVEARRIEVEYSQGEFLCRSRFWFQFCRNQLRVHLLCSMTRSALDAGSGGCTKAELHRVMIASSVNRIGHLVSHMGAQTSRPRTLCLYLYP